MSILFGGEETITFFDIRVCPQCTHSHELDTCPICDFVLPSGIFDFIPLSPISPLSPRSHQTQTFGQWPYLNLYPPLSEMFGNVNEPPPYENAHDIDTENGDIDQMVDDAIRFMYPMADLTFEHNGVNIIDMCKIVVLPELVTCAVCLDDMSAGRMLSCNHVFHEACARPWFRTHNTCPVCRHTILINQ